MAKTRGDFTDILVRKQLLGPGQIQEAKTLQQQTGAKLQDAQRRRSSPVPVHPKKTGR